MEHEIYKPEFTIRDTDVTFATELEKPYAPMEYIDELTQSNFLIIPYENFREIKGRGFPETTLEFYEFLKENSAPELKVDILANDESFQRIEMHSAIVVLATVIVKEIVLPLAVEMIAAFLIHLAKKYHRKNEDLSAKLDIIIESKKGNKEVHYEGPVSEVKSVLDNAMELLKKED